MIPPKRKRLAVANAKSVKPWEFIWWVHDDTKFSKKGEGAKVFLCLANDKEGICFIRINSEDRGRADKCFHLDMSYYGLNYGIKGRVGTGGTDGVIVKYGKADRIVHAHGEDYFHLGKIRDEDKEGIKEKIERNELIDPETKDRILKNLK